MEDQDRTWGMAYTCYLEHIESRKEKWMEVPYILPSISEHFYSNNDCQDISDELSGIRSRRTCS